MRRTTLLLPALILAASLRAQAPAAAAPAAAPAPEAPPAVLRAQYQWGYAAAQGQGRGTLSVLLEPARGRVVLELQGLGERLMLLEGDRAAGYRVQIPRQQLDTVAPTLGAAPLPFLPQLGSVDALYRLLTKGEGAGVRVSKKDASGPVKLRYEGQDERGKEVTVWLERTRWEAQAGS
jgi:hypothetical protein